MCVGTGCGSICCEGLDSYRLLVVDIHDIHTSIYTNTDTDVNIHTHITINTVKGRLMTVVSNKCYFCLICLVFVGYLLVFV